MGLRVGRKLEAGHIDLIELFARNFASEDFACFDALGC